MAGLVQCPECGSTYLIHDYENGEDVCADCGLVVDVWSYEEGPEWQSADFEEWVEHSRIGSPIRFSIHDKGLMTTISASSRDAQGKRLPASAFSQMRRLRGWQFRMRLCSSSEKGLAKAMGELSRLCSKLALPQLIMEEAAIVCRRVFEKNLAKGRTLNAIVPAVVYAICRSVGLPRTLKEIAAASLAEEKTVARYYRFLVNKLDIHVSASDPCVLLSKIASRVGADGRTVSLALEILRAANERRVFVGKGPAGVAATVLFFAGKINGEPMTQRRIARAAGVSDVTIRNHRDGLRDVLALFGLHERGNFEKSPTSQQPTSSSQPCQLP